jgi:hypothetical protein
MKCEKPEKERSTLQTFSREPVALVLVSSRHSTYRCHECMLARLAMRYSSDFAWCSSFCFHFLAFLRVSWCPRLILDGLCTSRQNR